jgi:hypothetical protein
MAIACPPQNISSISAMYVKPCVCLFIFIFNVLLQLLNGSTAIDHGLDDQSAADRSGGFRLVALWGCGQSLTGAKRR